MTNELPSEGWLNGEALAALRKIRGQHVAKRRSTVILLAAATASGTAWTEVFEDERACNQRIWYQKWQHVPSIANALEVCTRAALDYRDAETARIEALALQQRRQAIAQGSLDAVRGLRLTALNRDDRADYRTEASEVLLSLADEALAMRLAARRKGAAMAVEVENLDDLIERELAGLAGDGEAGDVGPVAGAAGESDDGV